MYRAKPTPELGDGPPPRMALRCPISDRAHATIVVRNEWFSCESCAKYHGEDGHYYFVRDQKHNRYIAHEEFVERWGRYVYSDGLR